MNEKDSAVDRIDGLAPTASSSPSKGKKHAYEHEKTLSLPSGLEGVSLQKPASSKRRLNLARSLPQKELKSVFEGVYCVPNQSHPVLAGLFYLRQVKSFRVREHTIAARIMKTESPARSARLQKVKVLRKEPIDRIMGYLSDT